MPMDQQPHASWAEVYDQAYETIYGNQYQQLTKATLELIQSQLGEPPKQIIDFGAGTGRLAVPLAEKGYHVTAVEPCQAMLDQLAKKDVHGQIQRICTPMAEADINEPFDGALAVFSVIIYLLTKDDLKASLSAAHQALRPGGMLILDVSQKKAFRGSQYNTGMLTRETTVQAEDQGGDLYRYVEKISMAGLDGEINAYRDEFRSHYWPPQVIFDTASEVGFSERRDLGEPVYGSGADYYAFIKPE
ncbi:MAG: class I SAM-dependent methyltransferase [Wenzhouxiangella sp.]|nr:class I SAM-dependent methyltransferase [Wenzhouxiangella sp.]